jgi:Protein of unknown function (DUF3618)
MGEKPDQIERHIYETRNELGENISELQEKVKTAVDWRAQFDQRPMLMIGLAFGGGLLLSALLTGRGNSRPSSNKGSHNRRKREARLSDYGAADSHERGEAKSTWDDIGGAVLAVAGSKLGSVIEEVLPGFQEHFKRRRQERNSWPQERRSGSSRHNGPESALRQTASGETDYMPRS